MIPLWVLASTLYFGLGCSAGYAQGEDLIGQPAPELNIETWLYTEPLTLNSLQDSVVLIRFWTDECPFCASSLPVLNQLHERYAPQGLTVIGIYHPKPPQDVDIQTLKRVSESFGIRFPIGLDPQWDTLNRYWLNDHVRAWTSVSLLIDRYGIIRFVHAGGSYSEQEARELEERIIRLLARVA